MLLSPASSPRMPHRTALLGLALALLLPARLAPAQPVLTWQELPNAPTTSRHNDVYFVTPDLGWIVNGAGQIYRTDDGGTSWTLQLDQPGSHFRSVGFLDARRGFAGNVGTGEFGTTDPAPLYETHDGGAFWSPITGFDGPTPAGLCGMHVVNDSTVVAVGRVRGPAFFTRTTDRGQTWQSVDMSAYAAGLIDIYFTHPDSGFAVGLTDTEHERSRGIVLQTTDGGATWTPRHTSTRTGEWAWKLSFPSRRVGYVSLQRNSQTPIFFLKTTDGGHTWQEKLFTTNYYFVQGIGFITETHGWIGGNSSSPVYATTDGGETWHTERLRPRLNRFRFLGDSLGYAVGRSVHKLANWTATPAEPVPEAPTLWLYPNVPNPFTAQTTLRYDLDAPGTVDLAIYDALGRRVRTLVTGRQPAGLHTIPWDGTDDAGRPLPSGVYFSRLRTASALHARALILRR